MNADKLKELLSMDKNGLLDGVRYRTPALTKDEKLISTFHEINSFIDANGREPSESGNVEEFTLHSRLDGMRKNAQKILQLKPYDKHSLLKMPEDISVQDVILADPYGLLDGDSDIFTLKHVPQNNDREATDFVAKRKPCPNFEKYEPLFKKCQQELKSGVRKLEKFNEKQRAVGQFFVVNGILFMFDKIHDLERGPDGKMDGRTKLIFENGTMSNMLFRSITKRLFENGQHVSDDNFNYDTSGTIFEKIEENDKATGYIYVLSSKSKDAAVKSVKNLFKVGYAEGSVEDRIKNASQETTYLMAPVRIVSTYKTLNMNPQKFENLLHRFFDSCRVSIDVCDNHGTRHTVREWFQIPFADIETAIDLLISGDIVNYNYDRNKGVIKLDL